MGCVRYDPDTIEHEHVQIPQAVERIVGDRFQIGRIGKIIETISNNRQFAVNDFERSDIEIFTDAERRIFGHRMRNQLRQTAAEMSRFENILKDAFDVGPRDLVGIDAHRAIAKIERTNIIQPENMVNVAMRNQNRVADI